MMTFYSVIRYAPGFRGERVNIGIATIRSGEDSEIQVVISKNAADRMARIAAPEEVSAIPALVQFLEEGNVLPQDDETIQQLFQRFDERSCIQYSDPVPYDLPNVSLEKAAHHLLSKFMINASQNENT